jgi:NAD(P)-dependent dehydrogenase (short-subunit alcohol dehydrogenase family)
MDLKLAGMTALVTGSTAGIGRAIAARLISEGATVAINGRDQARTEKAARELESAGRSGVKVRAVAGDLSTASGAQRVIDALPEVDILINNAGVYAPVPFEEITDRQWTEMFEANVMSGVRLSRHYLPGMIKRDRGRVVFVSSESGVCTPTEMIHYGVSKSAQLAIARGMAQMCAGTRVTVNSVLPGPTWSEGVEGFVNDIAKAKGISAKAVEEDFFKAVRPNSLIKRFASVEEVADMVAFVVSPLASATNGASLRCEGGIVPTIF